MPPFANRSAAAVRVRWCALALVAGTAVTPLRAQVTAAPVAAGDRVRITRDGVRGAQVHLFEGLASDTLIVRETGSGTPRRIPVWQVSRFQRSLGVRSRGAGALRGLRRGFVIGVLVGGVTGAFSASEGGEDPTTPEGAAAIVGAVGGVLGATIGLVVGFAAPGERWEQIELRDDPSMPEPVQQQAGATR